MAMLQGASDGGDVGDGELVMVAMLGGDGDDICWCWMVEVGWC